MNKHTHIWITVLIAIGLAILNNFFIENYYTASATEIVSWIIYLILTGGISYFLYAKFVKD